MLLSLFRQRRAAKAAALLDEAKEALQRQGVLFEEMHEAVTAYHATVLPAAPLPTKLSQLLVALEDAARDSGTRSRVFDDLTLTHCGKVRSALLWQGELERDLPSALLAGDRDETSTSPKRETPVNRHVLRRIGWVNDAAADAIRGTHRLNERYREEAGLE